MGRVYFINGFLDAGKTSFINEVISQKYFKIEGLTLLLSCEDGDETYDDSILIENNIIKVDIEKEEDFNPENIIDIEMKYRPSRVIVEFNGMWNRKNIEFPWYWNDIIEICLFDATTFDIYTKNMRSIVAEQLKKAAMAIINRCDDYKEEIARYRRNIIAINGNINVVFYDKNGEMNPRLDDDLPYDISCNKLSITNKTYPTFYIDAMENVDRYVGKEVNFTGMVIKKSEDKPTTSIIGRFVMTCCAEDLSMFGFVCEFEHMYELDLDDWVELKAVVEKDYIQKYDMYYPVLEISSLTKCDPPENEIVDLN